MATGTKNEQTVGFATLVSQRQDRGTILADGGEFTWEAFSEKIGGADLTVTGASTAHIAGGNFLVAGVVAGDTLEVLAGPNAGTYAIASVDGAQDLTIEGTFPSSPDATNRLYQVGSGKLSWTEIVSVYVPGIGKHTIAAGDVEDVHGSRDASPPRGIFVDVDRDVASALVVTARDLDDATLLARDLRLLIGVRGEDDRFYLADGTVLDDGDTKALGTIGSSIIDRGSATGDGTTTHFATGFDYVMGTGQLYVEVGGIGLEEGVDYAEADDGGSAHGDAVDFTTAPGSGEEITFINLAGGQGPQGPQGGQTLQEAYDAGGTGAGREVVVASGSPIILREDGNTGTAEILHAGTEASSDSFKLLSDGSIVTPRVSISDGAGGVFTISGSGGNLVFQHEGTEEALVLDQDGGIYFTSGGSRPAGADASGLRVALYAGTLADETVTTVSTGLATIRGVIFAVADGDGDAWAQEMNLSSSTTRAIVVTYDAAGDVVISGDVAKTAEPGEEFQARDYTLLVFY